MKKSINTAFIYAILGMVFGVFYREFTKYLDFTGYTKLSVLHTHSFVLGMFMFLIVALLIKNFNIDKTKEYNKFYIIYNLGLMMTLATLYIRGFIEAKEIYMSKGVDATISGVAGAGHILLGVGIIILFMILKRTVKD